MYEISRIEHYTPLKGPHKQQSNKKQYKLLEFGLLNIIWTSKIIQLFVVLKSPDAVDIQAVINLKTM